MGGIVRHLLGVVALSVVVAAAQSPAPIEFDAASIKRHLPDTQGGSVRTMPDGSLVATNMTLMQVLVNAYPSQAGEYIGLPDWVGTERYDIAVKPPAGATPDQMRGMWRALAADRLKLVAHDETVERPIYNLVLARSDGRLGPNLKKSVHDCDAERNAARQSTDRPSLPRSDADFLNTCAMRSGNGRIIGGGLTMERLAEQLRGVAGRVVRDRTGMAGFYVVDFTYALPGQTGGGATPSVAVDPNEAVSVFTALQEQLGLKLESDKMPLQHVAIEHIERPTEN
jgi:uncharacterized protein (TIGR03435 family)